MADNISIQEVEENFSYCVDYWYQIRREGREDMRYIAGDPWDPRDRKERKDNGRPCLVFDELSQYVNQRINDVRMNKRAVALTPIGYGANEKTAQLRAEIIRAIEARGGQSAYITAFENALQRSYGYFGIGKRFTAPDSWDQELFLRRIPNPDTVYLDPGYQEADASDMNFAFIVEDWPIAKFKAKYPKAEVIDFSPELMTAHPHWVKEKSIQVGEYWKILTTQTKLYLVADLSAMRAQPMTVFGDQVKVDGNQAIIDGQAFQILKERKTERRQVCQYITNGLEILEKAEWEGKWIPIVPCFGKEIWLDEGAGAQRKLLSLVRNTRDAVMLHNYAKTCEAEILGQVPKTPYVGYEGQFDSDQDNWSKVNKVPIAYLQVKPVLDVATNTILPLPRRETQEPPIQAFELSAESSKRSIQNNLGMYNASVGRTDSAAKSGKAIQALDVQSDQGNFHFVDNFDRALAHAGRIINDMIPYVYDTPRDVAIRKRDDSSASVRINEPYQNASGQQEVYDTTKGEHEVTISTGPSYQSQREEANAFADIIAQRPEIFSVIGDLVVKLKNLGPIGDEIADRLTPPQFRDKGKEDPQALKAQLEQAGQAIDLMKAELTEAAKKLEAKGGEIQSKEKIAFAEIESKERIEAVKADIERAKIIADNALANLEGEIQELKLEIAALRAMNVEAAKPAGPLPEEQMVAPMPPPAMGAPQAAPPPQ